MSVRFEVEGFKEIERALALLPRSTAKGVSRRAMRKELAPIASMANAFWPGSSDDVFKISGRVKRSQRIRREGPSVVNMFVGASNVPEAHLLEWGTGPRYTKAGRYTGAVSPTPMLQPAWDANKNQILAGLGARIWDEIEKTLARQAKRRAG